ncbi:MAG: DNA polymerase III subunit gamma/tau [Verrucomicrobiota bacterium]
MDAATAFPDNLKKEIPFAGVDVMFFAVSYQVLARKYRPQSFDEVVGQQHVIRTLKNAIATGRIPHAFLFVGPRGIGKTSTARILAKALNCQNGPQSDFDPQDEVCLEIAEGRCMDVLEIDGASNNGVEQVRDLRDNVQYAPTRGKFKLYVIDEVHMLSTAAFNALLKTLEEPPAHVKFIFATTEVHKLPATILSRCQRFDLKRISAEDIAGHLRYICEQEGITIESSALKVLARNAEGGLRDAESALEQLISFCGKEIKESDVLEVFGLSGPSEVWELAKNVLAADSASALIQVRRLAATGKDTERLTKELLYYFRNFLLFLLTPQEAEAQLDVTEFEHYQGVSTKPSQELLLAYIDELMTLEEKLRFVLVKDVAFEMAILRLAQQKQKISLEEVIRHITSGSPNKELSTKAVAPPSVPQPPPSSQAEVTPQVLTSGKKETAHILPASAPKAETVLHKVSERMIKKDISFRRYLETCTYKEYEEPNYVVRMTSGKMLYDAFLKSPKFKSIEKAIEQELGVGTKLVIDFIERQEEISEVAEQAVPSDARSAPREAPSVTKEEFLNDPLIKQAMEAFDARIVEVRNSS